MKFKPTKSLGLFCATVILLYTAILPYTAFADPGDDNGDPPETSAPAETPDVLPAPPPADPTPRPFPLWMMQAGDWPIWVYTVDVFPDWFYDLREEPVWFREIDTVPSWFYTLNEIPDWFYPSPEPDPADIPERELPGWMRENTDWPMWIYTVDEFPDWFYELEREPTWFREVDEIPAWFYILTEIPEWFYPSDDAEDPENPQDPEDPEELEIPPVFYEQANLYTRDLTDNQKLLCTVPDGMITNDDVLIAFPEDFYYLMRDEYYAFYLLGEPITEHGRYTLVRSDDASIVVYSFTIIKHPVSDMEIYTVPDGFRLTTVLFGDEMQRIDNPSGFPVESEGEYTFIINDDQYDVLFTVKVTIDRTPPALIFTNAAEDENSLVIYELLPEGANELYAPVAYHIAGDEPHCEISVTLGGITIHPQKNTLTEAGLYRITITDEAGNSTVYSFRIFYVMNIPTVWVIVIASIMVVALAAYLIYNRKHIKIR